MAILVKTLDVSLSNNGNVRQYDDIINNFIAQNEAKLIDIKINDYITHQHYVTIDQYNDVRRTYTIIYDKPEKTAQSK